MIRVELIEPEQLPRNLAGIAIQQRQDVTFLMRRDLTAPQAADWISRLGAEVTHEGPDAPGDRGQTAT